MCENLFKNNIPFQLKADKPDGKENFLVRYESNLITQYYSNNEKLMKKLLPFMYYLASQYKKDGIEHEIEFKVTAYFHYEKTIKVIANHAIRSLAYKTTIATEKENIFSRHEGRSPLSCPFHLYILASIKYNTGINKKMFKRKIKFRRGLESLRFYSAFNNNSVLNTVF